MKKRTFLIGLMLSLSMSGWAQETPQLLLQTGHSGSSKVLDVAEIPGGYLGTAASDGTVKVWNSTRKQVVRTVFDQSVSTDPEKAPSLTRAVFAPDGSWVVTFDNSGKGRRFSLPDGKLLGSFDFPGTNSEKALITDGNVLFIAVDEKLLKTDLSGKVLAEIALEEAPRDEGYLALSSDGSLLALPRSGGVAVLSTADFSEKGFLKLNYPVQGLAFGPDSSELALSSQSAVAILSVPALQVEKLVEKSDRVAQQDTLPVWTPEGLTLVPYRNGNGDPVVLKVDFENKSLTPIVTDFASTCLERLADGRYMAGGWGGSTRISSFITGETETLSSEIGGYPSFALLPDSKDLVTGARDGLVARWSSETGRAVQEYRGLKGYVSQVTVSPDGTKILAGDLYLGDVCCWDVTSGKLLSKVERLGRGSFGSGVSVLKFLDNSRFMAGSYDIKEIRLYDVATGKMLDSWALGRSAESLALNLGAGRFAVGYGSGMMEASLTSKRDMLSTGFRFQTVTSLCYGDDGKTLFAGTNDGQVWSWDYSDPKNQPVRIFEEFGRPYITLIQPEGNGLEIVTNRGDYRVIDLQGKVKSKVKLASDYTGKPLELPNKKLLSVGVNNALVFLDESTGEQLGSLNGVRNNDGWVAMERSGDFDGNDVGMETMTFQLGGKLYGVDQFLNQHFRPGVLARLLPQKNPTTATERSTAPLTASTVKSPPSVEILDPHSGTTVDGETVTVKVKVADQGNGVAGVGLIHNGHRLPENSGKKIGDGLYEFTLRPVKGKNEFRATAFDSSLSVEARQDRVRILAPNVEARPPKLHLLSVGLDKYESGLSLKFAEDDSSAVSKLFNSDLYQSGERVLLLNEKATLQGIKDAVKQISAKAEPQDALVIYLAGHGTVVGENYYFLPYDVKIDSDEGVTDSALSSEQLAAALREVPATKQLVVLDSCRSGAALGVLGRAVASRAGLEEVRSQQLLARASGTFLIAATKGEDYAYEIPQLGHGVLTYAILESLGMAKQDDTPAAKHDENGVTANDLLRSVSSRVPELSEKYQGVRQQVVQYSSGQDFPLAR